MHGTKSMRPIAAFVIALLAGMTRAHSTCVTYDQTSNSIVDFWYNNCSYTVGVTWDDQVNCHWNCLVYVQPHRRQSINKATGGTTTWRECRGFGCSFRSVATGNSAPPRNTGRPPQPAMLNQGYPSECLPNQTAAYDACALTTTSLCNAAYYHPNSSPEALRRECAEVCTAICRGGN